MLKKTIKYEDLDGNPIVEDFYFNLNKAEIAELELSHLGGLKEYVTNIVKSKDGAAIIAAFKMLIARSYGQRSEDNKHFIKSEKLSLSFINSEAYSELFMELVTNSEAAADFIRGVIPASLREKIDTVQKIEETKESDHKALTDMTREELIEAFDKLDKLGDKSKA